MTTRLGALQSAWRLCRNDERRDTYIGLAMAAVVALPVAYRVWRGNRGRSR